MVIAILILMLLFIAGFISIVPSSYSRKLLAWLWSFLIRSPPSVPKAISVASRDSHREMSPIKKAELKSVFATFDKNGDGFITKQELKESLKNIRIFIADKDVEEMVVKVDSSGDGLIDFEEFCILCENIWADHDQDSGPVSREVGMGSGVVLEEGDGEGDLKEAFDVFDEDKDGLISVEELNLVLSSLGLKEGKRVQDCSELIRKFDTDGDGKVNFEEFKRMMRGTGGNKLVSAF